ncbi:MAG: Tn7 transposase TnsA N-terminal domain-containing protein [Methylophilus sp.]
MLSRKVVTRSGRGFRGYYPSKKLNRLVQFESLLERDAIRLFETTRVVVKYKEQPTIIYYHDNLGNPKKYYPDFEVVLKSGQVIHIEVKPSSKLANLNLAKKIHAINRHYSSRQERFGILTEIELRESSTKDIYKLLNNDHLFRVWRSI